MRKSKRGEGMKDLVKQMGKFGITGALCFLIDYGFLGFCAEVLGIHYLIAGVISFTISVTVNYLISRKFVFHMDTAGNRKREFASFVFLSVIGLGINELVMAVLVEFMGIHYLMSKIVSTAVVMVYNFISRKMLLEKKERRAEA